MSVPNGPILFNSSTGSDSTASGLGPATAVVGSSAELDGTSAVDVSYDGMDLSAISAGDLLFCDTASGRKFSVIASVDTLNETITTDDAWGTESGVSWAVGGKRATFDNADSRLLFTSDAKAGFVIITESDQTLTSTLLRGPYGTSYPFIIVRGSGNTLKTLTATGNFNIITQAQNNNMVVYNLKFVGSSGNTRTGFSGGRAAIIKCQFGDDGADTNYRTAIASSTYGGYIQVRDTVMFGQGASVSSGYGVHSTYYAARGVQAFDCFIKDFYYGGYSNKNVFQFTRCIVQNTTIGMRGNLELGADNCVFSDISSHAIQVDATALEKYWPLYQFERTLFTRNVFCDVSGDVFHGSVIANGLTETDLGFHESMTFYLHNSSGFTGITFPSVTLTADPFTDKANQDFSLNSDAGGGAVLRAVSNTLGSTTAYPFNWLTDGSGGGGGGGLRRITLNGGFAG